MCLNLDVGANTAVSVLNGVTADAINRGDVGKGAVFVYIDAEFVDVRCHIAFVRRRSKTR